MRAAEPGGAADSARKHHDAEQQQREAADQVSKRLAPAPLLDAQVVGLAALTVDDDAHLGAADVDSAGQARDHGAGTARQDLGLFLGDDDLDQPHVDGPRERDGDGVAG